MNPPTKSGVTLVVSSVPPRYPQILGKPRCSSVGAFAYLLFMIFLVIFLVASLYVDALANPHQFVADLSRHPHSDGDEVAMSAEEIGNHACTHWSAYKCDGPDGEGLCQCPCHWDDK